MAICGHFGPKVALRGILTPHKTFDPGNYLIPMWAPSENPLGATFILEKIRKAISEIEYPPPHNRSGVRPYHVVGALGGGGGHRDLDPPGATRDNTSDP